MEASKRYDFVRGRYASLAQRYRQKAWTVEHVFGVRRLRRALLRQAAGRTLDVACGTGENFRFLAHTDSLTATDLSPQMLALAQQEASQLGLSLQSYVMPAEMLQFEDNSFDTVVSTMSTCTFADPVAALREMQRVCRPDGRILLIEHGRSQLAWLARHQDGHADEHFQEAGCRWNQEPLALAQTAGLHILSARRHFLGIFHTISAKPGKE
jgi:ubiquinone/menaquinone biosynthesis C-methylase UbiE